VASYSDAELEVLKLLRGSFSWKVSLDRRSGVWVATFAGECIRRDTPLGLYDALTLASRTRRDDYLATSDHERTALEPGDNLPCDCCQGRLEQLAAVLHEVNAQILTVLDAVDQHLARLAALMRQQIAAIHKEE
jgi:hypothetical protein